MPAPKSECMGTSKHCATLAPRPSATPAALPPATMYRVASKRSRSGCRNCKLRKVKCDETNRQQCLNCTSFGLVCNFQSSVPDMQLELLSASKVVQPTSVLRPSVTSAVWTADASYSYQLNAKCQDFITRYLRQSLCNPDDPNMARVNRELFALSFTHPYLMHASLAVALAYSRFLNGSQSSQRSIEECYHFSRATSLLNNRLQTGISHGDKDSIWGTAAAITLLCFATADVSTREESWPLAATSQSDLSWLTIGRGKMSLWHIVNPLRPDSIFSIMAETYGQMITPMPECGIDGIPSVLAEVCCFDESSAAGDNPYFASAHALSYIQGLSDEEITVGHTELFIRTIHGRFEILLRQKDPIALLLLYLWYCKSGKNIWWIELRARVECPAIHQYLRQHLDPRDSILGLLEMNTLR